MAHKELDVTDPLQRVIDWQLKGVWPEDISKKKTKFDLLEIKTVIRGNKSTSALNTKEELENRLINAIDLKINRESRDNQIYRLYTEDGYKQAEIANITGVSQSTIHRILKKVCTNRKKMNKNDLLNTYIDSNVMRDKEA